LRIELSKQLRYAALRAQFGLGWLSAVVVNEVTHAVSSSDGLQPVWTRLELVLVYRGVGKPVNVQDLRMIFKTMKREDVLKALQGQENILKPAVEENERYFRRLSCPECGGDVMPVVNPRQLYKEGGLLPNYLAKCRTCSVEFDPYTKIQVSLPDL
jgi:hypothetical protein